MTGPEPALDDLDPYEQLLIREIARHMVHPSALQSALEMVGRPIDLVLSKLGQAEQGLSGRLSRSIEEGVRRAVNRSVTLGGKLMRDRSTLRRYRKAGLDVNSYSDVQVLDLEARDRVADGFDLSNAAILTTEGAVMGAAASLAEAVPGAQIVVPTLVASDVAASMTLLSRHLVQLASAYGFSVRHDQRNIAHVLGAMVPQQLSYDEGFVPLKIYVMNAAREAGDFAVKVGARAGQVGFGSAMQQLGKEAPQLIRLMNLVVERLGLRVSQKVFGMLVPVVGGAINGGINLAFQQTGHRTGKDYFRLQILGERYGDDVIKRLIDDEVARLRSDQAGPEGPAGSNDALARLPGSQG